VVCLQWLPPATTPFPQVAGLLPHYVAVDHARREVVVSVRGSLSVADVVTDFAFWQPAEIAECRWGRGQGRLLLALQRRLLLARQHVRCCEGC